MLLLLVLTNIGTTDKTEVAHPHLVRPTRDSSRPKPLLYLRAMREEDEVAPWRMRVFRLQSIRSVHLRAFAVLSPFILLCSHASLPWAVPLSLFPPSFSPVTTTACAAAACCTLAAFVHIRTSAPQHTRAQEGTQSVSSRVRELGSLSVLVLRRRKYYTSPPGNEFPLPWPKSRDVRFLFRGFFRINTATRARAHTHTHLSRCFPLSVSLSLVPQICDVPSCLV